ncbi:E3 SUMO-protein ligase KIAA1586-like [Ambystoma mexicanum]|uniref:E3 SUMO-protein ligase KIAA1586-like n=1 Tax=Ambystoma mexicanum TaxID=8296 RepID=UPI0037E8735A
MVERRGKHSSQCEKAIEENSFQGVALHEGKACDKRIEHGQFFRSLAENVRSRLLSTGGSATADNKVAYEKLISELKVLYMQYWPDELPPTYGESEIESLCERFDIGDTRQTIRAYREHRETGGKEANRHYKELLTALNTIAISTAECEQGFSQMNLVCTSTRASLHTDTISSLLLINLVGPPLKKFNPIPYVNSWIAKGRRAADDPRSKERKEGMARHQLGFETYNRPWCCLDFVDDSLNPLIQVLWKTLLVISLSIRTFGSVNVRASRIPRPRNRSKEKLRITGGRQPYRGRFSRS